jgi:hypothetical protein
MNEQLWKTFENLWRTNDYEARERFAEFEDLPRALILEILASEGDLGILKALAANFRLPLDIAENMYAYKYALSQDEDTDLMIYRGLARNTSLSIELLQRLANCKDEEIAEIAGETLESL